MALAPLEVIPQQQVKDLGGALHVLRHHLDEPAGLRVHGGQPHHIGLVLAQALGALHIALFSLQRGDDVVFFLV